ncbi:MAG TPA: heavy-metal-associated domain-containing protein [Casimicrobiaceae bacterium]
MKTEVLKVTGMTCGGCVASVKGALGALPGVKSVDVSLPKSEVQVQFDESRLAVDTLRKALQGAGYDLAEASAKAEPRRDCCCS